MFFFLDCTGVLFNETISPGLSNGTWTVDGDTYSGRYFVCGSGETISFLGQCNGFHECVDSSDEAHCQNIMCRLTRFVAYVFEPPRWKTSNVGSEQV